VPGLQVAIVIFLHVVHVSLVEVKLAHDLAERPDGDANAPDVCCPITKKEGEVVAAVAARAKAWPQHSIIICDRALREGHGVHQRARCRAVHRGRSTTRSTMSRSHTSLMGARVMTFLTVKPRLSVLL
jgi:hypothetical protein